MPTTPPPILFGGLRACWRKVSATFRLSVEKAV
jgi:hypothetical protein